MPYDQSNTPSRDDPDHLVIQVEGGAGEPERLLMISRPRLGKVRVREWTTADPKQSSEREVSGDELLASIERAASTRRRVSAEIYRIRAWLKGPEV